MASAPPSSQLMRAGESFRIKLDGYFLEQQHGQTVDLCLEYGYSGVLPLESMPDYRLIQLLVEEVLYVYEASWIDVFWEIINRELVRRILSAFPQLAWTRCELSVRPSALLPIGRTSVVDWAQEDLPRLAPGTGEFSRELPDACWYSTPGAVNIGAPRCLLPALKSLYQRLLQAQDPAEPRVLLSFAPLQLHAPEGGLTEMVALCEEHAVYDALILPRRARALVASSLRSADAPVGALSGLVELSQRDEIVQKAGAGKRKRADGGAVAAGCATEYLLADLLGRPAGHAALSFAEARRGFVAAPPRFDSLLLEERFAGGLLARGYPSRPAFAGEPLELCLASRLSAEEAERVERAVAAAQAALASN